LCRAHERVATGPKKSRSKYGKPDAVKVLATVGFALSMVDESKDSAGMTSDTSHILPSSNQTIYTSERSEE
jgi:hypothetical protein